MAFAATVLSTEPRAYSTGPLKEQIFTYSVASADTSGTITAIGLTSVVSVIMDGGLIFTALPTFSGNVVTLAFNDPAATNYGTIVVRGR